MTPAEKPFRLLDTLRMKWEDMPGIPGFKRRVLRVDAGGGGSVEIQFAPPGFSESILARLAMGSVRHFHRSVTERHYFLSGDLPNCDWRDLEDANGRLTVYRRHMFLDRPPLTLHGLVPDHVSVAGSEFLVWNTGSGTALWEADAERETVEVSNSNIDGLRGMRFVAPTILHTDRLPLQPHARVPGWKYAAIAPPIPGMPQTTLTLVPFAAFADGHIRSEPGTVRWLFVISGSLSAIVSTATSADAISLFEGSFLDLDPSAQLNFTNGAPLTDRGCMLLCVGISFTSNT